MLKLKAGKQFWDELHSSEFGLYEDNLTRLEVPEAIELIEQLEVQNSRSTGKLEVSEALAKHILWCLNTSLDKWQEWAAEDIRSGHLVRSAYRLRDSIHALIGR